MKYFCCFLQVFAFLICSCSGFHQKDESLVSFESYLKRNDSEMIVHMKESKETRQKKMTEAFSYLDRAAFAFEKEGRKKTRKILYSHTQKVIDEYTTGFYILNQDNPEDFQQFYLESIAEFKACFYILMKDSLKNISDQTS